MSTKTTASFMTFVKYMVYSTAVNLAATMPSQDSPLFWKLLGGSALAAAIKALLTYATTKIK